jgi:hypothetical protein
VAVGKATAEGLTAEKRSEIAKKAAARRWAKDWATTDLGLASVAPSYC